MSFNAAFFNPYRFQSLESDVNKYAEFNKYLREKISPDILCIQEFFYSSKSEYDNTLDSIANNGNYDYYYTNPNYNAQLRGLHGVITFSRLPVVNSGALKFENTKHINGHWNDFIVGNDTIRVLNFQLESMSIRWNKFENKNILKSFAENVTDIYVKLSEGYKAREEQLKIIIEFLLNSPYKVIICADINALPYSDTYQILKRNYNNAFEYAGLGFGFTYHHFPWLIRIDNQFFDKKIEVVKYETLRDIEVSDHYPILAWYNIKL